MQGLIQRVSQAKVVVNNTIIADIDQGVLVFLGIEKADDEKKAEKLLHKILNYRIFSDAEDKMNLSLKDINGQLLIVSQFTLAANTKKGMRPSFSSAAAPDEGLRLYNYFVEHAKQEVSVSTGEFGADMKVHIVNDGPVTFRLEA